VKAGLDALAHSVRDQPVDDELIAEMKKRGAWQLAATLTREASVFVYGQDHPSLGDSFFTRSVPSHVIEALKSPARREKLRADPHFADYPGILEMAEKNLKRLFDAGVNAGMGTDSGPPARFSGYFEHWEMELMVEAGLTPMQVLQASTQKGAQFLGATEDLGTIEAGRWADMVVLSGNPLESIKNTRSIETVWIAGNRVQ
jgi:hypothetical protein